MPIDSKREAELFYRYAGHGLAGLAAQNSDDPALAGFFDFLKPKQDKTYRQRPTISMGATGSDVTDVQRILGVAQSGTFDFNTEMAVKAFQTARGIGANGVVAGQTWAALLGETYVDPAAQAAQTAGTIQAAGDVASNIFGQFFSKPTASQEQLMLPPTPVHQPPSGMSTSTLIGVGLVGITVSGVLIYGGYRLMRS